jgi:hypothetical protein
MGYGSEDRGGTQRTMFLVSRLGVSNTRPPLLLG